MLLINQPCITEINGKSRLIADIIVDNNEPKQIYFEVEKEYAKYLCYERSDAFLIGLLGWAMRFNHDIKCIAPVTEELLYNINEYLMPSLYKNDKALHKIEIFAPTETEFMPNAGGVGTGMSCGVDSFHTVTNQYNSKYKSMNLTHLCINSVGSFHIGYKKYGQDRARDDIRKRAAKIAEALNLPLIITDSNIKKQFNISFDKNHTYYSMFAVYCMQKLWRIYYYSSGITFENFNLIDSSEKDTAYYDLLSLQCLSTHNLHLYSEGATEDRLEKTRVIVDDELVRKYLHVCCTQGINCGTCKKCRRTLLTLDILGKLDEFRESFDIDYYKSHRDEYLMWLYEQCQTKNAVLESIYNALKNEFDFKFKMKYRYSLMIKSIDKLKDILKEKLIPIVNKFYTKTTEKNHTVIRIFFIKLKFKIKKSNNAKD